MTINTEQWFLHPVQIPTAALFIHAQPFKRQRFAAGGVDTFSSRRRASAAAEPPKL